LPDIAAEGGSPSFSPMLATPPIYCRPAAYRAFEQSIPHLDTTDGLLRAAIAVSMHELDDVNPSLVFDVITALADEVHSRVQSDSLQARLAHLHEILFDEFDLAGNTDDYYSTTNSYVPEVILTKRGLPITLSLVYKAVAEKVGLSVTGINAPGHFMVAVQVNGSRMLVDPFCRGRTLSPHEAEARIEETVGEKIPPGENVLSEATHRQWISRILRNLQAVFLHMGRHKDEAAMRELADLLPNR
jgi:regulator of sirC expression with transglutaminase-like and TPR domain